MSSGENVVTVPRAEDCPYCESPVEVDVEVDPDDRWAGYECPVCERLVIVDYDDLNAHDPDDERERWLDQ